MVRRRTTSRPAELLWTVAQILDRMRDIGARGDPDDPEYETIRQAAVRTLTHDYYPSVDRHGAEKIFNGLRLKPHLLPGPGPRSPVK